MSRVVYSGEGKSPVIYYDERIRPPYDVQPGLPYPPTVIEAFNGFARKWIELCSGWDGKFPNIKLHVEPPTNERYGPQKTENAVTFLSAWGNNTDGPNLRWEEGTKTRREARRLSHHPIERVGFDAYGFVGRVVLHEASEIGLAVAMKASSDPEDARLVRIDYDAADMQAGVSEQIVAELETRAPLRFNQYTLHTDLTGRTTEQYGHDIRYIMTQYEFDQTDQTRQAIHLLDRAN